MQHFAVEQPLAVQAPRRSVLASFFAMGLIAGACLVGVGPSAVGALHSLLPRAEGLQIPVARAAHRPAMVASRGGVPAMDETILEKTLAGELEQEGAENHWMSEAGWAQWLDQEAESSYNMNERPSKIGYDKYFTPDAFSNPLDVIKAYVSRIKEATGRPLDVAFPTISNDVTGTRSYPKGLGEVNARTIKPKTKDFDKDKRIVGIPGFNAFGSPSSKSDIDVPFFGRGDGKPSGSPAGKASSKKSDFKLPKIPFFSKDWEDTVTQKSE